MAPDVAMEGWTCSTGWQNRPEGTCTSVEMKLFRGRPYYLLLNSWNDFYILLKAYRRHSLIYFRSRCLGKVSGQLQAMTNFTPQGSTPRYHLYRRLQENQRISGHDEETHFLWQYRKMKPSFLSTLSSPPPLITWSLLPGTSPLEPVVHPTNQVSNFRL